MLTPRSWATVLLLLLSSLPATAQPVPVRHKEGTLHGFLWLLDASGKRIASGDLMQYTHGSEVTARLVFHFLDGSLDDETTVFTQSGTFRLLHDRHVQSGPSYPHPIDIELDVPGQRITMRDAGERKAGDGARIAVSKHFALPPDLANGLALILTKNLDRNAAVTRVSYLAATPSPRLVHVAIRPGDPQDFTVGRSSYRASCFVVHVELGGIAGMVAPLIGAEPAEDRIWVVEGKAPSFVRAQIQFYEGGPRWSIELASPDWPGAATPRPVK